MHALFDRNWKGLGIDLSPVSLPHVAVRMFSCVGCFWVLLSAALVAICSFSFISPAWIVKDHLKNKDSVSFGLLWHCSESMDHMYRCYTFGGLGKFQEIPSSSWQILFLVKLLLFSLPRLHVSKPPWAKVRMQDSGCLDVVRQQS
ncbi:hypothetical protein DPX16_8755 [Anabarilius grahami]|uniref:Uncharacterized protein n=1 Tax=Anabarilius grahami TaxID=495550 RepID=A0A3N0YDN5_ANAGA|nr:hypothetical protein DPX16_8755 [Anabarilius grahami]